MFVINAMVFLPMAQAPPQADATELLYCLPSKNLIDEFTSLFSTKAIFVGMPKKTFPRKQAFVDRKQGPRFSQGQPKWAEPIARMTVV